MDFVGERKKGSMDRGGESSLDVVLRDEGVVANIVSKLQTARDRYAAASVCRLWHDAVTWQAPKLALRSRASLPHIVRPFKRIVALDLSCTDEQLSDSDLEFCAISFRSLRWLCIGGGEHVQEKISDAGLVAFVKNCGSLEHFSIASVPRIGDAGIRGLLRGSPLLRVLRLESIRKLTDDALGVICEFPSLVELHLKGEFKFTSAGLARIGSACKGLTNVCFELGPTDIGPALKSLAEGCPKLQDLCLKFWEANLKELAKCTNLRSLSIETHLAVRWRPIHALVAIAQANKNLQELSLVYPLTDAEAISIVLKCPELEKLYLEAEDLTEAAVLIIGSSKTLRHLYLDHLSRGRVDNFGLCGTRLKSLSLKQARGVRDMALQTLLDRNRCLELLDLQSCINLSHIGFYAIAASSNLKVLDLSYTNVDDLSLMTIAIGAQNLQELILIKCQHVYSMTAVARFKCLESLNVDQCQFVCDEALATLSLNCSLLAHLSLAFTRVTDAGLIHLAGCSLLRSLRVSYCRFVKGDGVVDIARASVALQHVTMSHRFRNSQIFKALKEQCCRVSLEMDDMALVPFGNNLVALNLP